MVEPSPYGVLERYIQNVVFVCVTGGGTNIRFIVVDRLWVVVENS